MQAKLRPDVGLRADHQDAGQAAFNTVGHRRERGGSSMGADDAMKLIDVQVKKYKCVDDSDCWHVDQITCLVGKNESGKTALLEALYKLNPVEESKADFTKTDYPRKGTLTDEGQSYLQRGDVVITHWHLECDDLQLLNERVPELQIASDAKLKVTKGYGCSSQQWHVPIDEERAVRALIEGACFDASESSVVGNPTTIEELVACLEAIENRSGKYDDLLNDIMKAYPQKTAMSGVWACLSGVLPHFIYFSEYERLPGKVSIDDMRQRQQSGDVPFGHKVFRALLELAKTSIDDIENTRHQEELIMQLEAVSNRISDEIFEYWSQNQHLRVEFRCESGKPDDPPPFNSGTVFQTRIRNERHRASVNFDERSTGFIWFFSFLVWFSQMKENYGDKLVVLLDEPGLTLHGKAQHDLLRYIKERLGPTHQVIYTTHSPFMLDGENIFSLRTVEDVIDREEVKGELVERIKGTKVGEKVLSRDRDTILPLQGYIGYDIANTFFIGPYMLVVEGPSEVAYINWFSRQLVAQEKEGLDIRWAVAPAEGAPKVTSFVTLFKGRGLKIAALMDYHEGQKKMVNRLDDELMEEGYLLKTTDFVDQDEADIEDLVGWELYAHLVNESLGVPTHYRLSERPEGHTRIVKAMEAMTNVLPPAVAQFDHLKPARHLYALDQDEVSSLPGLEYALGKFGALFERLNKLIR